MIEGFNIDNATLAVFLALLAVFTFLGFYGVKWRKGDLRLLHEWALAGRRLGWFVVWFLLGADLFTAYTFIAVPSGMLASGPLYFFAVPYVAWGFAVALITMPKLWEYSKEKGYVTAADFVKDRFGSKSLSVLVALVGAVAELPYIALQIVGMQAVLAMLLIGLTGKVNTTVSEIALVISFIILAAFTWTSGLRGATLTGVFKDVLIWITVLGTIGYVVVTAGGFSHAFEVAGTTSLTSTSKAVVKAIGGTASIYGYLPPKEALVAAYFSLAFGSAFALYLYPHAINASLSSDSSRNLKVSTALMPIYGIGLALIALFAVLLYDYPQAVALIEHAKSGALTVPALIGAAMPDWFVGLAFAAIFIGGLVPAAVMAIAVGNLVARNVVGELRPLSPAGELKVAKWTSFWIKFIALAFVFTVQPTYAISLQLLGGILIAQTLPAVFIALFTRKLNPHATLAGLVTGLASGIYMVLVANKFGLIKTTLFHVGGYLIFIALLALGINLAIVAIGTAIAYALGWRPEKVKE
ncbi:MAG: sodium:solute symporter [Sulfolobales archaeon]|nr:sodium:solute symporter [Sulfolobales archaeon]